MLTLFYSPHATSVDNETGHASGHADVPLSPLGRQQAQELGPHYAAETIQAVYCSDLQRATATAAAAFGGRGVPIVADARLRECDYGVLTQAPREQIDSGFISHVTTPFPNGESVWMVVERVGAFLREVIAAHDQQAIVVIGHRATRYALEYWSSDLTLDQIVQAHWPWLTVPIWRYQLDATTLTKRASG